MGLTVLPTQTDGSLGRVKADLDPVPEPDHYVSAAEYNKLVEAVVELAEAVGLADGSTAGSIEERLANARVLWKWNETDVSQFGANLNTPSAGTIALSFVAAADGVEGPRIRITSTGHVGRACFPVTGLSLPRRFIVCYRLHKNHATSGSHGFAMHLCHNGQGGADFRSLMYFKSVGDSSWTLYAAYDEAAANDGYAAGSGAADTAGAEPGLKIETEICREADPLVVSSSEIDGWIRSHEWSATQEGGRLRIFDTMTPTDAHWDGETLDGFGIGRQDGAAQTGEVDISDLVILRHPMDE